MPDVAVSVQHSLGRTEAMKRARGLLADLKRKHGDQITDLREQWSDRGADFSFLAMGFEISGRVDVSDQSVTVTGKLPWAAGMFKGKIEDAIRRSAQESLG